MKPDKEYILKMAHENRVKFIRLWFTDILGFLKSFAITLDELEDALEEGVRFDGSTLDGFIRTEEREMLAVPDPATFAILPWRPRDNSVARLFCDIHTVDGKPFEGDSRYILKKNLLKAAEAGLTFYTGPEIEFFFFKNSKSPEILDRGGYFDLTPLDSAADYRRQTVLTLEDMGIGVISSHHEGSPSQHEIDLRHDNALATADNIMSFRLIAKEIGQLNDIYASFMPKHPLLTRTAPAFTSISRFLVKIRILFLIRQRKTIFQKTPDTLSLDFLLTAESTLPLQTSGSIHTRGLSKDLNRRHMPHGV